MEFGTNELHRILDACRARSTAFFALFEEREGRTGFNDRAGFVKRFEHQYRMVLNALELLGTHLNLVKTQADEILPLERRVRELGEELMFLMETEDERFVYWVERRGRGTFLQATPIDVSEILAERLFGDVDTVVLTSATLAVEGKFDFIRGRLGIGQARDLVVPGHFNYREQALLYIPSHLPDPRDRDFTRAAAEEVIRILEASRGRAFVLFTSYQQMRAIHDIVSFAVGFPALLQGSAPRSALLEEFRTTPNSVLFATSSFWQGVDVPGEKLSCVIIDKLPFAVPSDPVVEARIRNLRKEGKHPFYAYQVPQAVIALKQGFGRLIRNTKDRGILALLDNRVLKQQYGQVFLRSLPDYAFTTSIVDVNAFFEP
jgi:ATP-dependent DNA helicase DinG